MIQGEESKHCTDKIKVFNPLVHLVGMLREEIFPCKEGWSA